MLFKWLFTLLAIVWLWFVGRRYFASPPEAQEWPEWPPLPPEPEPEAGVRIQPRDDADEYIDYEEVRE
jgi:hypothetical protein